MSWRAMLCRAVQDAASYFQSALAADPEDAESAAGLANCRAELEALRAARAQQQPPPQQQREQM